MKKEREKERGRESASYIEHVIVHALPDIIIAYTQNVPELNSEILFKNKIALNLINVE